MVLVGLLASAVAVFYYKRATPAGSPDPKKIVEVVTLKSQPFQHSIRLLGTIHPAHATVLVSKGAGTLDALIPSGQKIKKGTLIAKIINTELERSLQLSISAETLAKAQFDRFTPLLKSGFVSTREIEEKKQAVIDAQKNVAKAQIELDNLRFYAPFDGVIGAYKKREGTQVNPGDAVVALYDPATLVVDFDIPCHKVMAIHEGQPLRVLGHTYALSHVQKMLDEETHMCPADVDIVCDDCVVGSTVALDLVLVEKKDALVIPMQSVFLRNGKTFVYVVDHGQIALKPVTTGLQQDDTMEVVDGLEPGALLISKGTERLYPGLAVDIDQDAVKTI
ncbi:efflux RND transporter periplasmic adaptor subunit [Legionella sp. CNM-4043-24]|uniref:efflux RND transporter periplasmic adaptor subunit n=1 Tax=Legionella sp. CNM-4043-24 TaxID=3421646 RepID=UPI00403AA9BF